MEYNNKGITDELVADIVADVKTLEGISNTVNDNILILYAKLVCWNILIYTRRRMFAIELYPVAVQLVKDKFDINKSSDDLKSIQSMSEYDRSVSFGISDELKSKLDLIAKDQIDSNKHLLNEFRLLYRT